MRLAVLAMFAAVCFAQAQTTPPEALVSHFADDIEARYAAAQSPEFGEALGRVAARLGAGALPRVVMVRAMATEADEAILAGGRLFVPTELLRRAKDDDELAAMVAHALAHGENSWLDLPKDAATIPMRTPWPAPNSTIAPMTIRTLGTAEEHKADVAAVDMLGRAGIDAAALVRFLERANAKPERVESLRGHIRTLVAAATPAAPTTSECEVVQALLDDLYSTSKRELPSLKR